MMLFNNEYVEYSAIDFDMANSMIWGSTVSWGIIWDSSAVWLLS